MKKAVVVDDNDLIRSLVSGILTQEGFEIVQASNGKQLFDLLGEMKNTRIDLICLDVIMPGMNGFDILTRLKLHPETSNIPVIMLTAEDTAEDIMTGYNVGADYYVTKPFTPDQLLEALEIVLG